MINQTILSHLSENQKRKMIIFFLTKLISEFNLNLKRCLNTHELPINLQ